MSRALRTLLLWVIAFAMPVQGMAASAMQFCGPSHARMLQGAVPSERQSAAGHDHLQGHEARRHDHAAQGSGVELDAPQADGATTDEPGTTSHHHGKVSCSACAACCSMMVLPSGFALPAQPEPARGLPLATPVPVQSHLPDGLDRPPRARLA